MIFQSDTGSSASILDDDPWINVAGRLDDQFNALHHDAREQPELEELHRISVALYDSKSDHLRTFLESNIGPRPLERINDKLSNHPALVAVAQSGRPRIDNAIDPISHPHGSSQTKRLVQHGFRSRYVVRVHRDGVLYGFIFFNSRISNFFSEPVLSALTPFRRLIDVLVVSNITSQRGMLAAVRTALQVSQYRDEETAAHLDRMGHYAELIAQRIAAKRNLSDEYVEYVYQYAPLHDLGKVAIPDSVLLKPGKLTPDEFEIMKTHVAKGVELIDSMVRDHGLEALPYRDLLRNIVGYHHERFDGTGYPNGLLGITIPLEARIVAVADVFDALTSKRPYKDAWTNDAAMTFLREQAGRLWDPDCVEALLCDPSAIAGIQQRFRDPEMAVA
ncbi:HD domain-containing phosphohydrolase [Azospirillum sp. SYSU D00513]|uniref:HD-GYP domain-containing protein n=1 Tax=Azospirillum sp. SYSU D00513 TaxID=2812561 RepID=UPI001A96FA90|nr:HD domain-containing phosphohydrolase [Azospirillum sp. SYSU D00513]